MRRLKAASTTDVYARVALLGFVTGLRSLTPLALLAVAARRGGFASDAGPPLSLLQSPWTQAGLVAAAVGEIVGDKLPSAPSRLDPIPLLERLVLGAITGAAVTHEAGLSIFAGGGIGAAAAAVGSIAGNRFRALAGRLTGLPDLPIALVEDATVLGLGSFATQRQ
jgi:uncharacterized membrane protein